MLLRIEPNDGGEMGVIAAKLGETRFAAHLNEGMFGLVLDETDIGALEQTLIGLKNSLLPNLNDGAALFFGAARFPFDAINADSLITLARVALAKAKRDEIVIYGG